MRGRKRDMMRVLYLALAVVGLLAGCVADKKQQAAITSAPVGNSVSKLMPAAVPAPITSVQSVRTDPRSILSLQPYRVFAKGAGEGYAREYRNRTKTQFIALLRSPQLAKRELRVSCDVIVRQMAEAHPDLALPFEGCEGAAKALQAPEFKDELCRDEMFERDNYLAVTNESGREFGAWHRKCLRGKDGKIIERVLTYKSRVVASLMCLNTAIPVTVQRTVTLAPPIVVGLCPNGWKLWPQARNEEDVPGRLHTKMHSLVNASESRASNQGTNMGAYTSDDVSRTLGGILRLGGVLDGVRYAPVPLARVNDEVRIQYLDLSGKEIMPEKVVNLQQGEVFVDLPGDPRAYVVKTMWPSNYLSPTVSGGARQVRLLGREWTYVDKQTGQEKMYCTMVVHGIRKAADPNHPIAP